MNFSAIAYAAATLIVSSPNPTITELLTACNYLGLYGDRWEAGWAWARMRARADRDPV